MDVKNSDYFEVPSLRFNKIEIKPIIATPNIKFVIKRIVNINIKDSARSQEDIEFWKKLEKDKEQNVNKL